MVAGSMGRGVTHARPRSDEVEITLFGPGYGESVVVHAGGGEWLVVDSCLRADGEPAALGYRCELNIDPAAAVKGSPQESL